MSRKSVLQECPAKSVQQESAFKSALQDAALLLDDCASHLHKEKTSIFISALVSVHSALHKVTAFGFVGSISFFFFFWGGFKETLKKEEMKHKFKLYNCFFLFMLFLGVVIAFVPVSSI